MFGIEVKKFINDFTYKLIANIILIVTRNVIVLPFFAFMFSNEQYGEILTLIGIVTTIAATLGNSLLSARLVLDEEYRNKNFNGDFNIIILFSSLISVFFLVLIFFLFNNIIVVDKILLSLILVLETFIGYHSGWFILKRAYKELLHYTLITCFGFMLGIVLAYYLKVWTLVYLLSDVASLLYLLLYSPLVRECYVYTCFLKIALNKYIILIGTTFISNVITYLDRLFLYPLMGSESVAIYTTSSILGKGFSLIALPVSSIMLGYYATGIIRLNLKKFWITNASIGVALLIFMACVFFVGEIATGVLFPNLIASAKPYITVANIASALGAGTQIAKASALKYAPTYLLFVIQAIYAALYIGGGYYAIHNCGLYGFSIVVLISNLVQLFCLIFVGHYSIGCMYGNESE